MLLRLSAWLLIGSAALLSDASFLPAATPSQGRVEAVLAGEYRKDEAAIKKDFAQAGFSNAHFQFMRQGQPPSNIGVGREVSAERGRAAIRLALQYNRAVTILLPAYLLPPQFITIASSNYDDTVEFPIDAEALRQLQEPSLTTEQFHNLYRHLTTQATNDVEGQANAQVKAQAKAMLKDAEDMVSHGGMGDAKAIVHHCHAVTTQAEAILKGLPLADAHGQAATPYLHEAIKQCQRVATFGSNVDPGVTLNPATKARAAVRAAAKSLAAMSDDGKQ